MSTNESTDRKRTAIDHSPTASPHLTVPYCEGCGTTRGRIREFRVDNREGTVLACDECEDDIRGTIVEALEVSDRD